MKKSISLIGFGMGSENSLTIEAKFALENAQIVFGAKRLLESAKKIVAKSDDDSAENADGLSKTFIEEYRADEIFSCLKKNPRYEQAAVLFSGDTGFFSGANAFFAKRSGEWEIRVFPGISSAVYFASKLQKSWQNWKMLSLHGAKCNTVEQTRKNPACFFILSWADDVRKIGEKVEIAQKNGVLGSVKCYLGSNLSYDVEKIIQIEPGEMKNFADSSLQSLFVLLIENENSKSEAETPFLCDEDFIRAEKIPMTKKEVRQISICALALSNSSIIYDIGSGTGSVTVEMARIATEGEVFAIEKNEAAFSLTQKNVEKFCLENATCLKGEAAEILKNTDLPSPTHIFIGGSGGNLSEIVRLALGKNPNVRIVANFVSLEGLCEMQNLLKSLESEEKIKNVEITQISVSRAEKIGNFHLMKAVNPVFVVSFSGNEKFSR